MSNDLFIPKDTAHLFERMKRDNLLGVLSFDDDQIRWALPNNVILYININTVFSEGYIGTGYLENGKEKALTHWHPDIDEVYSDLLDINCGNIIWAMKKTKYSLPIIFDKKEFDKLSDRKKSKYKII